MLRISTLVFSIVSPFALVALLLRCGLSPASAAFAVLVLLVHPLFVYLSFTFMADVSLLLVLRESSLSPRGWAAGGLVCAAMLAYATTEQADHMAWNTARWTAGRALVQRGARPEEIQGGFEWVGVYDFEKALPIAIASGYEYDLFAWAKVFRNRYILSFEPQRRTRVVSSVSYRTRFGPEGTVYVLERTSQP